MHREVAPTSLDRGHERVPDGDRSEEADEDRERDRKCAHVPQTTELCRRGRDIDAVSLRVQRRVQSIDRGALVDAAGERHDILRVAGLAEAAFVAPHDPVECRRT